MTERVVVYQTEGYGYGFPEKAGLLEFAAWLSGIIEQIPEEHRSSAWIEIGTTVTYGDDYPRMEIGYSQPSDT